MINFYEYYNKNGLDNEHYSSLISQLIGRIYSIELEPIKHIIKKSPDRAYFYARVIIRGRWEEAEPIIMKNSRSAYKYARFVMVERWKEAESYIKQDRYWWEEYCDAFDIC